MVKFSAGNDGIEINSIYDKFNTMSLGGHRRVPCVT